MLNKFITKVLKKLQKKRKIRKTNRNDKTDKTEESRGTDKIDKFYESETSNDVIICVGEEPNVNEFHADSKTLRRESKYFKKVLSDKNIEKRDEKYVIKKSNITPQVFNSINKYIRSEDVNMTDKSGTEILNIFIASNDLKLKSLTKLTKDILIKNHQQFLRSDPIEVLHAAYSYKTLSEIQISCLETICYKPEILFNSSKFINLSASILEIILKRDDLALDEIEIWDNLIKWGLAQEKNLDKNVSEWQQEEFTIFERILHKFIPFIRFYDISSEDYYDKIEPYDEIIPKELQDDILKFHMLSEYKPTINTHIPRYPGNNGNLNNQLINRKHLIIIENWIKWKDNTIGKKYFYNFKLLYRASRDGNTSLAFHAKCDNKEATIVIAKITNSEQIVGGYNPLQWDSKNNYKPTKDSFIFYFKNRKDINSAKISRSNGYINSIGGFAANGPVFGGLACFSNAWENICPDETVGMSNSYPRIDDMPIGIFKIEDYEVFQVVKKS
ncbi:hypothetical protein RclHR1_04190008 [Rhizophagus clarus]|uniref:BTB/POZ domain-containing protein n=1 Tax=Rhizophagus clarus TaxID=94130 RepID=A0A2Z6RH46_9GLOM|nr:hypothetical protein RclHR1_04190008 [Rhizophagus clarus]GES84927.1 BTB/POZ domain-containing protein [Rhizophagus clarus]